MRIKTTKKMRLDELIKYVWENDVEDTDFFSNEKLPSGQKVKLHVNPRDFDYGESGKKAGVSLKSHGFVVDDSYTFTVKVEEELTEETVFKELVFVYDDCAHRPSSGSMVHKSIQNILRYKAPIYKIYTLVDRSLVLIWSCDTGIPEEGVIEV